MTHHTLPRPTRTAIPVGVDTDDGLPVWAPAAGAVLAPGVRAWRELGVGHRCQTWLGWESERWAPVVIKLVRPHQTDHPRARLALEREVRALTDNPHPGLPLLIRADLEAAPAYLVEQYVDGPDLEELIQSRRVRTGSVPLLAVQLLAALAPVQARGLVHLDVKPANVIVVYGRAVLVDFGSARPFGSRQPEGHPVGTAGFTSPEQEACEPVDPAMDVYGVGATLRAVWGNRRIVSPRGRRIGDLIDRLTAPEVRDRPSLIGALDLARELHRPGHGTTRTAAWPDWL